MKGVPAISERSEYFNITLNYVDGEGPKYLDRGKLFLVGPFSCDKTTSSLELLAIPYTCVSCPSFSFALALLLVFETQTASTSVQYVL